MTVLNRKSERGADAMLLIRVLSVLTLVTTYCLIVLGSTVRVTNSGMGCKDWPLCSGQVGPLSTLHPLMEQSHRYLASLVTVLIVALALATWRAGARAHHVYVPALASVGVIVVQIVLGAITVISNNAPVTVALHLLVATLFLGVVTITAVAAFVAPEYSWSLAHGPGRLAWSAVVALYLVFISGSIVVNGGAQSACTSWPACFSSPAAMGLVTLQLIHRSMVLVGSVLVVAFVVSLVRPKATDAVERNLAYGALVLLALQILVGALTALDGARAGIADVHLAVGSALWCTVVAVFALAARARPAAPESSAPAPTLRTSSWRHETRGGAISALRRTLLRGRCHFRLIRSHGNANQSRWYIHLKKLRLITASLRRPKQPSASLPEPTFPR